MLKNGLCHFEFLTPDTENTRAFYSRVFNWEFKTRDGPMKYEGIDTGTAPGGGRAILQSQAQA